MPSYIEFPNLFGGVRFNVSPEAFTLFGFPVYWYGIIITAAVALGIAYALKRTVKFGLSPDAVFETAFWGVGGGIVGARLYYIAFSSDTKLTDFFNFRGGGLAIYGGLIGALAVGGLAAKVNKVRFAPLADLIGLGFLIGHTIGRWGNFFNQETFGAPTTGNLPWGMTGNEIALAPEVLQKQTELGSSGFALVHPCFLYESLWCLVGFVFLHIYSKKLKSFDGEIFLLYVIWYGTGRGFIEGLRTDSLMLGDLRVTQVLGFASAAFALVLLFYFKRAKKGVPLFADTDEGKSVVEDYKKRKLVETETEKAKDAFKKAERELTDPFAETIMEKEIDE